MEILRDIVKLTYNMIIDPMFWWCMLPAVVLGVFLFIFFTFGDHDED